jgi:preprotein translocase subunit SecA
MFKLFKKKETAGLQAPANFITQIFDKNEKEIAKIHPLIDKVNALGQELKSLSDDEVKARSLALKERFRATVTERLQKRGHDWQELDTYLSWSDEYISTRDEIEAQVLDELHPEAFALCREAGDRTIGLRHFDVQLIGGTVLHTGRIAEMKTGEGKTLVATLPTYLNALSGRGVHIITVNDYLAERDANWMRPIYEFLGLTVSFLQNEMDNSARQAAYACDVLYATNSEVGFDYLRDNMARRPDDVVQRPLNFAIVDEVDNILIDEARTPLIISAQVAKTERALRRQQLSKVCDGVARQLMPAITDREVETLIDSYTNKGRISIDGLMGEIEKQGSFTQATQYLIEAYLLSEKSSRTHNAARLLDVADEYFTSKLLDDTGRAQLETLAAQAVKPENLRHAWREEIARLVEPFAHAWAHTVDIGFDSLHLIETLATDLALSDEVVSELPTAFESGDAKHVAAGVLAAEAVQRGLLDEEAPLVNLLIELDPHDYPHDALTDTILETSGPLNAAENVLLESVPETAGAMTPPQIRVVVNALESIAQQGLLPFQTMEKLWDAVQLSQKRETLRDQIAKAMETQSGAVASRVRELANAYLGKREQFLQREAAVLRGQLSGHEAIAKRAENGENAISLRAALQNEITKSGPFAQAMKEVRSFVNDQKRAHSQLAEGLVEEMAQWVEVPKEARKQIAALLDEGGTLDQVRERVLLATRDLPGENTELPALTNSALHQLAQWREEKSSDLLAKIGAHVALSPEGSEEMKAAINGGAHSGDFENFVGAQLLSSPQVAPLAAAIDEFGTKWDAARVEQNVALVADIEASLPLSPDAHEALEELLSKPLGGKLDAAIFSELASDAVSRHLESLLTPENALAFAEEIKRRIPLAKEVQNKLKAKEFEGRSAEQLQRAVVRLVERSLQIMPFEDYKRVVKNLAWLTEKDERRRTAALTDMGTLLAEREAGALAFAEPENFLETLLSTDIITDEEAATIRQAQLETPHDTIAAIVDRVLRLPAERRRRLSEAKQQEVQPILDQSIKAHALFHREINYVIGIEEDTGKRGIVIVDEFTGRKMPGRRYSEGLHEALEAKHNLEVQLESQTVATITIQNYFRLYRKLGGMTGTAKTEEQEFAKTYGVEVISIPTNRIVRRVDHPDIVYKTAEAKFRAISFEILEHHCAAQPVLAGTRSVEVSERLSDRLKAGPLQTAVLAHLCKTKLWETKEITDAEREQILQVLRSPILQLPLAQVKNLAKQLGVNPDPTAEENLNKLLSLFTSPNPSRERLQSALKNGLPHNVLNAKNHRSEARIVAEAARPGAVTIATNMAGRGVDILLGGSLDVETRWRVTALQVLGRHLQGLPVHARSRNQDTTNKLEERLSAANLQELAWLTAVRRKVEELERSGVLQGQAIKEMRDALGQEVTTADLRNKVRSRARRLNLLEQLPLDFDPAHDLAPAEAIADELHRLTGKHFEASRVLEALQNGVSTQSHGRDEGEIVLLETLAHPLGTAQRATAKLLETLSTLPDLDRQLLEQAANTSAARETDFDADALATEIEVATPDWVRERLKALHAHDAAAARHALERLKESEAEINEAQIAAALGEDYLGPQWLRERLRDWNLAKPERSYDAPEELRPRLADSALVHYRLDRDAAKQLCSAWQSDAARRREMVVLEAPNYVLLSDMAQRLGHAEAPFLDPNWLHQTFIAHDMIGEGDVFEAQMQGHATDENGQVHEVPLDVLVYRLHLPRVLGALQPTIQEAVAAVGNDTNAVQEYLHKHAAWAGDFIDEAWVAETLSRGLDESTPVSSLQTSAAVLIETGVAGQSADIVLESEPRPEDIAHTSERDIVQELGGLHIIGSERHESRRIDNQLRGRAGRQGDPGSSRFFISLEDELWRLFGTRGQFFLNKWDEDEPVEAKIISKSVERAQKKVELNHFESRKHVLQYDDVMNLQREKIYGERRRALMGENLREFAVDMTQHAALGEADKHCPWDLRHEEWDAHKLYSSLVRLFGGALLARHLRSDELLEQDDREEMDELIRSVVAAIYAEREAQLGEEQMRSLERWQVMRSIDEYWMEHLAEMDYLRDAIWQEGYAQKEPIGVFRQEGYELFHKMLGEIRRQVTEQLFSVQLAPQASAQYAGPEIGAMHEARLVAPLPLDSDGLDDGVQLDKDADGEEGEEPQVIVQQRERASVLQPVAAARTLPVNGDESVGRNDPCPCGSGKKYKLCHGQKK